MIGVSRSSALRSPSLHARRIQVTSPCETSPFIACLGMVRRSVSMRALGAKRTRDSCRPPFAPIQSGSLPDGVMPPWWGDTSTELRCEGGFEMTTITKRQKAAGTLVLTLTLVALAGSGLVMAQNDKEI